MFFLPSLWGASIILMLSGTDAPAAQSQYAVPRPPIAVPVAKSNAPAIVLGKPLDCELGSTCFIQNYADHDPDDGVRDYACGTRTNDGNGGTAFRLPDKVAQDRGVNVLAAAPGVVSAIRDGIPDFDAGVADADLVRGKECGNGVVIDHRDGWQTQYCNMRQGSVRVHQGQKVDTGTVLGLAGQSGFTSFIDVFFIVRHYGRAVDPFAPDAVGCTSAPSSLWAPALQPEMAYHDVQVMNTGFASTAVSNDDIERGNIPVPTADSPALVAYVRAIHLRQGDVQSLVLTAPDDHVVAQNTMPAADHDKAQFMMFEGAKADATWQAGLYTAHYEVLRAGVKILGQDWSFRYDPQK